MKRVTSLLALACVACGLAFTSSAVAGVAEVMEGGDRWIELSPGVWEDATNGGRVILNGVGKVAAVLSKKQVLMERKGLEAIAANVSGGKSAATVAKTITANVPDVTSAEASNASNVLTKAWNREGLSTVAKSSFEKVGLETGGMLTAGQMIAALGTGIGVITLGPTAFKLGVELGNGLDQLIGFPSWDVYEKEESPKPAGYSLRFCEAPAVLKAENREFPCPDAGGGTFVVYRQGAFAVEDEWVTKPGCEEPIHSFIGSQGIRGNLVSGTSIYGGACEKYNERAWFYELCKGHATEGTGTCMPPEAGGAHVELPETGPLTPEQQTVNKAHGLEARPHVKPPELKREEHLTPKQHAQWWWGEPGKQGHLTPAEFKKLLEEHENGKEPVPFNESELEPGPKFIENNSPEPETETETPTEPAPPETPGLAVPGIHWPNFAALCKNFPFGVPCWLFLELHEWAGAAVVPKWEFHFPLPVIGGTVSMKMSLESLEPAMEILRPIIALVVFVELVLLFYRLAMGGSPNTSSTTDSDEG